MYTDKTIDVYKKLLQYTANYCETNFKYYSNGVIDYDIIISYKGNKLITLQHSTNMKRSADNIATSIAKVITDIFRTHHYHTRYLTEDMNGDYTLSLDDTGGYSVSVVKKS